MGLKLDMAKAYDRLEWRFLLKAMEVFGFFAQSRDLIYRNICNIEYQFRINGEISGSFRSSRGVRQGDPLSPLLFVLAQQILSLNLKLRITTGQITGFKVGRDEVSISHLLYADDILIFTNGTESSLSQVMTLLRAYERSSRQPFSQAKSRYCIHDKYQRRSTIISRVTGLNRGSFPLIYLGVPIFYCRVKTVYFEYLLIRFEKR